MVLKREYWLRVITVLYVFERLPKIGHDQRWVHLQCDFAVLELGLI
jgi:hypothetical protein